MNDNKIKDYWNKYYSKKKLTTKPSDFAKNVKKLIIGSKQVNLIDIGSGNFRDTFYFLQNGFSVSSLDINKQAYLDNKQVFSKYPEFRFINKSISEINKIGQKKKFNIIYSRFFIHSINELDEKRLHKWSFNSLEDKGYYCLEFRVDKDKRILKYSTKKINKNLYQFEEGHFRRLINPEQFLSNILKNKFIIKYVEISDKFSVVKLNGKTDNPILMRAILSK